MKTIIAIYVIISMSLIGCGLDEKSSKKEKTNNACASKVCNVEVVSEAPLTVSFSTQSMTNQSYTFDICPAGQNCVNFGQFTCSESFCDAPFGMRAYVTKGVDDDKVTFVDENTAGGVGDAKIRIY